MAAVTETSCSQCGERSISIPKEGQLLQLIALVLLTTPRAPSGPELKFLRKSCQLSQAVLADSLRKRRETVAEREAKSAPRLSEAEDVWFRLIILREFNAMLARPRADLLSSSHRARLTQFTHEFSLRALELGERTTNRVAMRLQQSGEDWQPLERAA